MMAVREALNTAIREEMIRDENVFLMGEEVAQYNVRQLLFRVLHVLD